MGALPKRILIVEDDFFVAMDLAENLRRLGATVQGPVPDMDAAAAILEQNETDLAILDINLDGEVVFPLAERLSARGVPFVFATGYSPDVIPVHLSGVPVITKPYLADDLLNFLLRGTAPPQIISQNKLLAAFPEVIVESLMPHMSIVPLIKGKHLVRANQKTGRVYFPTSGLCSLLLGPTDDWVEVALVGFEGMVGMPSGRLQQWQLHVLVQAPGFAISVNAKELEHLIKDSASLATLLLDYQHTLMMQCAETAAAAAAFDVPARLARFLLVCSDRIGPELAMVHDFLSMMLNVRRAGVTEAMQLLEKLGAIETGRGRIKVQDETKLKELANWSYGQANAAYSQFLGDLRSN